jgi:hypothetical protein
VGAGFTLAPMNFFADSLSINQNTSVDLRDLFMSAGRYAA